MDAPLDTIYRDASTRVGTHDMVGEEGSRSAYRPIARGARGAVSSGHMLSTFVGCDVLRRGGNAADAGVAVGLSLCVVEHDRTSFGGVAPIIYYDARSDRVTTIDGLGRWPKAVSLEYFDKNHGGRFSPGISTALTPLAMDGWLTALQRFGTWTFEAVVEQALAYAEDGFPVSEVLREDIIEYFDGFQRWPTNAEVFSPGGRVPDVGDILIQPALANSIRRMIEAERKAGGDREAGIQAVRDFFYRGDMGRELIAFSESQGGLLSIEDMEEAVASVEESVSLAFGEYELHTCDAWTQGPAILQVLAILQGFDLEAMGHNSADYVHTITEAIKVAYADRDAYYGDPKFVSVPFEELLAPAYSAERRKLIDPRRARTEMAPPGKIVGAEPYFGRRPSYLDDAAAGEQSNPDTTIGAVIDRDGNIFCAAPSDPALRHPIDAKLGFGISPRGTQSWLHPNHPSVLAPGKRPRLSTNPILVKRRGKPCMALCTPGGDVQQQTNLQVFLNIALFGMNPQQATEAPRFSTFSFPNSFYPHLMRLGEVAVESRLGEAVIEELASRGHTVKRWPAWSGNAGGACVIVRDPDGKVLHAGADPRRDAYALAF